MTDPTIAAAIRTAHSYAHQLRDLAHATADTPTESGWRHLRFVVGNVRRWSNELVTATARLQHDELTAAYLQVVAAIREAETVVGDLEPLYRDRASPGATRQQRAGVGSHSRPFVVRYGATCGSCRTAIRPGQTAVYDRADRLHHHTCVEGSEA